MILLYLLLLLLIITPTPKINTNGIIFDDYYSQQKVLPVKGIFVILILLSHFKGYITLNDNLFDKIFVLINYAMGQLVVSMFFFYSGGGIYESIKQKGKQYISNFLKNRLLFVWISFAICLTIYLIVGLISGNHYELKIIILSYIGWDSIGNSNWFMFVTFVLYILFYISFSAFTNEKKNNNLILFSILTILFIIFLDITKDRYWWDTVLCFPLGMWYSRYKDKFDEYVSLKCKWLQVILIIGLVFIITYFVGALCNHYIFLIASCCFCLIIVMLTMKIQIRNPLLIFFGNHIFSIYMLQRLWFSSLSQIIMNRYVLLFTCIIFTSITSIVFDKIINKFRFRFHKK